MLYAKHMVNLWLNGTLNVLFRVGDQGNLDNAKNEV